MIQSRQPTGLPSEIKKTENQPKVALYTVLEKAQSQKPSQRGPLEIGAQGPPKHLAYVIYLIYVSLHIIITVVIVRGRRRRVMEQPVEPGLAWIWKRALPGFGNHLYLDMETTDPFPIFSFSLGPFLDMETIYLDTTNNIGPICLSHCLIFKLYLDPPSCNDWHIQILNFISATKSHDNINFSKTSLLQCSMIQMGPRVFPLGRSLVASPHTHCLAFTAQYANILMGKAAKAYALVAPTHLLVLHFSQNVQDLYQEFPCI